MNDLIYLDYNGTTPIDEKVIEVINQELKDSWGNPSSGSDKKVLKIKKKTHFKMVKTFEIAIRPFLRTKSKTSHR